MKHSTFHVENFGCRATQADGAAIERQLLDKGLARADAQQADIVILNTCTVTSAADSDARAAIRRIHRHNPSARILVTGCYAQRAPEEIAQLPGVELVAGNSHKHEIAGWLSAEAPAAGASSLVQLTPARIVVDDIFAHTQMMAAPVVDREGERTRANLKVQDGCNNRCSFCVIPHVRGRSRSLPVAEAAAGLRELAANGYREAALTGINLGKWGRDFFGEKLRFVDLLKALLDEPSASHMRLRISSVEPMDWSDELIAMLAAEPRLCRHAHVPLQSGSERILRLMRRRYHIWHYEERIARIHAAAPEAAIGADVMTGFPGEGEREFEETRAFIERLPFAYLHVFTYSARPGMPSTTMPGQVPVHVARERTRVLRELSDRKRRAYQEQFIGRAVEALTLTAQKNGRTEAITSSFQTIWIDGLHAANQMLSPRVAGCEGEAMLGEL